MENGKARSKNHRSVTLDQDPKRQLRCFIPVQRKLLEQLRIRQTANRPDAKKRLELLEGDASFSDPHENPPSPVFFLCQECNVRCRASMSRILEKNAEARSIARSSRELEVLTPRCRWSYDFVTQFDPELELAMPDLHDETSEAAQEALLRDAVNRFLTPRPPREGSRDGDLLQRGSVIALECGLAATAWGEGPTVVLAHGWESRRTHWSAICRPAGRSGFSPPRG